ncbi:DUF4232 domain-containing protein [Actinomadura parmotrematis]|uniref:DUF4232 domain-containing protein n=1 Tax=Actinomadura parmotrematis TaxID=2864039 RepID=A0ABS7G306_9ACTN|nr:DUF4232 domain-containing protein [Actinomadura parmotrematis]MBW8487102.1 DUF4232 domain-containing protein [Actinomadura parmotrematis]
MRIAARAAAPVAGAALMLAGAACSSGGDGAAGGSPGPSSSAPAATPPASGSPGPSGPSGTPSATPTAGGTAAGGTTPRCSTADLRMALEPAGAAAGSRYAYLVLTNRSGSACRVYGYVGMQLYGPDGRLPTDVRRAEPSPSPLVLKPNGSAYARLQWTVVASGGESATGPCEPTPERLEVTPPDERTRLSGTWSQGMVCAHGRIRVTPLAPGRGT